MGNVRYRILDNKTIDATNSNGMNYTLNPSALADGVTELTVTTPEIVITPKKKYNPYSWGSVVPFQYSRNSYYKPEDIEKMFNVFTLGGFNNITPTQLGRRIYDLKDLISGNMSGMDYMNRWIFGNEGTGSEALNAVIDVGIPTGYSAYNVVKNLENSSNWYKAYRLSRALNKGIEKGIQSTVNDAEAPLRKLLFTSNKPLNSSTSLAFFERPSKISEAESLGFGRSRGFNPKSGSDLHEFYTLLDRRQTMLDALRKLKAPENMGVDEIISKNSGSIIEDGFLMSNGYRYTPVTEKHFSTGTNMSFGRQGIGGSGHNYGLNLGGQSSRVKGLDRTSKIVYSRPGANLDRNDPLNLDIVITAENNKANKRGIKILTKGMRDMESGAEFSGDASSTTAAEALSSWLRLAKNKPQLRKTAMSNAKIALDNNAGISLGEHTVIDPIHGIVTENATMSPDAYSYLYRTAANNPDKFHLGYTMKAGNFNSFARNPKNAYMYDVEQNYLDGLITPQEYIKLFNSWSVPLGGRRAYLYNGQVYKPQPFLIRNKQGGKIFKKFAKGGKNKKATSEYGPKGLDDKLYNNSGGYHVQGTDHPVGIDASGNVYDQVTGEGGPVVLDEVTVSPKYAYLNTWRPLVDGAYKATGHSQLLIPHHEISNYPDSDDYNLFTNNCSDATRRALEKISGKRINPFLFTTPGDVKDFAENELGGITTYNDRFGHYTTKIPINQKQKETLLDLTEEGYEPSLEEKNRRMQTAVLKAGRIGGQAMYGAAIGYHVPTVGGVKAWSTMHKTNKKAHGGKIDILQFLKNRK